MSGALSTVLENRGDRIPSIIRRVRTHNRIRFPGLVASGRQKNVDKGSRQIRSVSSQKGLALKAGLKGGSTVKIFLLQEPNGKTSLYELVLGNRDRHV